MEYIDGIPALEDNDPIALTPEYTRELRDALFGMVPYSPELKNVTLGNGTLQSRALQVGNIMHWWARLVLGSTSSIDGLVQISLPKVPLMATATPGGATVVGQVLCRDVSGSGGTSRRPYTLISDYTTDPGACWPTSQADGSGPTVNTPWAWAAGDSLDFSGAYLVAAT